MKLSAFAFESASGEWVAQCVEHDITVSADCFELLQKKFRREVMGHILVNEKLGRKGLDGIPALPEPFRSVFQAAKDLFYVITVEVDD